MKNLSLFPDAEPHVFDGATYDARLDGERLSTQLARVRELMSDGKWRTLAKIANAVRGSEPAVSARLRDLRKPRHGGWTVDRRRRAPFDSNPGVWEYAVTSRGTTT